jgi:hypothetical protein
MWEPAALQGRVNVHSCYAKTVVSRQSLDERDPARIPHTNGLLASVAEAVVLRVHVAPPHFVTIAIMPSAPHHPAWSVHG